MMIYRCPEGQPHEPWDPYSRRFVVFHLTGRSANQRRARSEIERSARRAPSYLPHQTHTEKVGKPVEGKILEPVFVFDREVIPAGSLVTGSVSRVQPVTKWQRFLAIVNGDFTPLRRAFLSFDSLTLPDGSRRPLLTSETTALSSVYVEPGKKKNRQQAGPQAQNNGAMGTAKKAAKDQINGAINARTARDHDIVRGPNKKEKLIDFMWAKLPYHPQYLRRGHACGCAARASGWSSAPNR